jgi:hypothetical protein
VSLWTRVEIVERTVLVASISEAPLATKCRCEGGSHRNFVAASVLFDTISPILSGILVVQRGGTPSALVAMVKRRNVSPDVVLQETLDPRLNQREIFEIDRSNLALQLQALRSAIFGAADEIQMVALESVFRKALSRRLTRSASDLRLVAKNLDHLLRLVERALPEAPGGRPKPRNRGKKRT